MDSITSGISASTSLAASTAGSVAASEAAQKTAPVTATVRKQSSTTSEPPKQEQLQRDPRSLQFQVDGNRVITTIVDENNNTVVVQIPDADMIRIAKAIDRMQGFLVQEKA